MSLWRHRALAWVLACCIGGVVRWTLVAALDVWTPDGRLGVSPATYGAVVTVWLATTGVVHMWLTWRPGRRREED